MVGLAIWCGIAVAAGLGLRHAQRDSPAATSQLMTHLLSAPRDVKVTFDRRQLVAVNDPVFLNEPGSSQLIGRVAHLGPADRPLNKNGQHQINEKIDIVNEVTVTLFGGVPTLHSDASFTLQSTPQSTEWVIKTMLPVEKRQELVELLMQSYRRHMPAIAAAFQPVVKESLQAASGVIREDLQAAFEAHEDDFQALGKRFEAELLQQEVLPLIQDEVWPIVEERSKPLVKKVGTEVWQELSLWRFGWRFLYDKSPLPERNFTQREFNRFVKEKAAPILKAHLPEMVDLQKELVIELAEHPRIRATIQESYQTIANDQELRELLTSIFQEVLLENSRLPKMMQDQWTGPRAKAAVELANRRLDPTINRIGEAMFGNPNTSITPEFARVMRRMVLHKDQRWFLLDLGTEQPGTQPEPTSFQALVSDSAAVIPSSLTPDTQRRSSP